MLKSDRYLLQESLHFIFYILLRFWEREVGKELSK
jgi:hypothetical protein